MNDRNVRILKNAMNTQIYNAYFVNDINVSVGSQRGVVGILVRARGWRETIDNAAAAAGGCKSISSFHPLCDGN